MQLFTECERYMFVLVSVMKVVEERNAGSGVISKLEGDILTFYPYPNQETTGLKELKQDYEVYKELTNGKPLPLFSDNRELKSLGSAEQSYIKTTLPHFASKLACLVDSPLTRFLHNTFLHLYRPEVPVKIFSSEEKAFDWLRE